MDSRVTIAELFERKRQGRRIAAISCYDHGYHVKSTERETLQALLEKEQDLHCRRRRDQQAIVLGTDFTD